MAGHVLAKVTSKENSIDNVHIISSSFYGVCNSPANTANKEVIVANPNITNITLVKGMLLTIKFTFDNTVNNTSLTLFKNVGSEEIPLKNNDDTPLVSSIGVLTHEGENNTKVLWTAGSIVSFIYNGTNWIAMSSSNTARTDLSNVDNAWIQNGVIRNGVIGDAQIGGVSANKLTAGTIDASNIHVTNLRADNLIVTRMNGQPVIGGYTVVNSDAAGYEEMNPVERGWYEIQPNGTMVRTEDTEVDLNKVYYSSTSSSVALYDQNYINNMETELNNRIDGAIETFSGKEIPTEHNKPYTDWYDTTVSPIKDDRRAHVGDLYYIIGAYDEVESTIPGYNNMSPVEQEWYEFDEINQTHILSEDTEVDENKTYYTPSLRNGYCYRFYEDSTTNTYSWVLIKDSDVTAALSSISELQDFNEQLSHWEEATDEGVISIRQKFTTLSGKVDNTITSAVQVWYTGTASPPSKPNQKITSTATTSSTWTTIIPDYNDNAPYYYYCWQYLRSDNTCTHSEVIYDKTTTENQQIARDAAATANGAISGVDVEYISITSNTTPPSQEDLNWHSTITAGDYGDGLYIWQRTKTTTRTSISYTQPVCISGRDGQGAYIYSLTCNPSVIVKDNNGNFSPTAVAFSATRAQGTNTPVAYEGRFIIQESEDGSNWTTVSNISDQTNTTSVTYNTPISSSNIKLLKGTLYMGGTAAITPVDTQTVPIVTDGQNGQEGHDAYTVLLTNESHTFAANTSNALTASVTSEVIAYKGATRVTASIGTIANTTTGVTAAIVNNTNNTISPQFSVSVGSAVTAPQGIITIPVQVDGHNFEKQFAWALAFKGSEGKGIKSVTEYYALNNSTTAPTGNHSTSPSVWSTAIKTPTKDNKYVWNYEVITYTDNTTATPTTKHIAATYGETGAAGKSISNIVDYYQTTTNTTAPSSIYESTTTPNGWSITVQNPTSTNKYLWNYEQISYTDGSTPATTDPRIIGVYGDSGISATKIEEEYIKTNSSTNTPSDNASGWSTTQPTWEPNYYIWTRSKITWSAPNPSMTTVTTPVLARGLNSANETAADAQAKANSALKSNIQLWTVNGGNGNTLNPGPSTPSAPTAVVTTTATTVTANSWTLAVPTYTPSLSYYYYCLQQERGDGQYQWTTPVYDPTTSDMMKTTSEIITFEQTTNKTITDTVSEQSSKITQLTNETKTIANPNLSPFFSHDLKDVYNSSSNPTGYWAASPSGALVRFEDGWAHFEPSNTVTSQTDYGFNVKPILNFGTIQQTVTILVELRNISWTGTTAPKIYCPYSPGTTIINAANFNIASNTTQTERFKLTTKVGNNYSELFRGIIRLSANSFAQFDIRISLYEGDYNGPYKPYVDQIGLATLTNTVNEVKQTATANSSIISQLTRTVGVGPDGNPVETPSEDSLLYRAAVLEQDLDGFRTTVTETYNKINSRGEQLVTNGNGLMGDNTNYTSLTFDGSKANGSPGSFTHIPQYYTCFPEEKFPIDPSSEYIVSCDAISADGTAKAYGCVYNYDIDGNTIEASHIGYVEGSLTTLARELKTGDTKVYLTDVSGFMTTTNASHQRSLRFWDYKNSYNYMYPPETYTRNVLPADSWASDSAIDRSANTITLKTAYSGPTHAVGTYVSEGLSGSTYLYFFGPSTIPTTWTNFNRLLSGTLSNGNPNTFAFRPGTAYCGVGFLWNYGMTSSSPQGQMWVTNISMMKSSPSSSEFKTAESKITQNANNIELKVSESDVTGNYLVGKINLSSTTATISADRVEINGTAIFNSISSNINNTIESKGYITTTAANNVINEAVNNLEIGGRNLLPGTKMLDGFTASVTNITFMDGVLTMPGNASAWDSAHTPIIPFSKIDGNDITVSFEYQADVATHIYICTEGLATNTVKGTRSKYKDHQYDLPAKSEWTKWSVTFPNISLSYLSQGSGDVNFFRLALYNRTNSSNLKIRFPKMEKGNKATDWSPAPEDVEASISNVEQGLGGFDILWNRANFANDTSAGGECYLCAYDPTTAIRTDENGWAMWNGTKRTITKGMFNPNTVLPYNIPIYIVCRLSSSTATTGTNYMVWYNSGWKSGPMAPTASTIADWTWAETTDMVLGKFVEPNSEAAFTECETYRQPLKWGTITTDTVTARSANAAATAAQTTANNAAPKASAVKRTQRIYYRASSSMTSWVMPTTWLATTSDVFGQWTCKVPRMTANADGTGTKYLYLYTCEQREMANGTLEYTTVLLDDSTTVIDGGTIITGSITANKLNATDINASNMLTVGSMTTSAASSILNSNIIIGGKNLLGNTENRSGSTIGTNSGTGSTFGSIGRYNDSVSLYSFVDYDGYSNAIFCATSTSTGNRGVGWYTKVGEIRAGETYTFSCRIKCSIATNVHMHTAWRSGSATASYTGWTSAGIKAISADTWTDYSYTFVPASNAQLDWEFFVAICITGSSSGATYQVAHAKLEKGTKVTDWSPAPEELQSNAIKRTQRIYYRKSATGTPTAPASWVTSSSDGSNTWTQKHMSISNTDKYIYTCEQYEMADGRLGNTPILLDDTITVIDGGRITTGTIDASIATITNINADNITAGTLSVDRINAGSITLGKISNETQNLILNGVNLLRMSELLTTDDDRPDLIDLVNGWISDSTPSSDDRQYNFNNSNWKIYLDPGDYILSWEINEAISNSNSNIEPGIKLYKKEESTPIWESLTTVFNTIGTDSKTISLTETTSLGIMFKLYDSIVRFKLEKGTVATNWSLSPEDEDTNLSKQFENTKQLIEDNEGDIKSIENLLDGYSYINENQEQVEVQGLITTVNGKLDAGYLKSWLYADENYLALGKTDPNTEETIVRAVLNSEALTFEKQGEPVATYGGEDGMNSPRAVIDDEFRVGNFMWVNKRSNHHVSFKYVGGTT